MPALPLDHELERIETRHHGARLHRNAAFLQARPIVDRVDHVHRKPFEKSLLDHADCAAFVFLGGLENKYDPAGKIATTGQMVRCAEKHSHVAVVATRMHDTFVP